MVYIVFSLIILLFLRINALLIKFDWDMKSQPRNFYNYQNSSLQE